MLRNRNPGHASRLGADDFVDDIVPFDFKLWIVKRALLHNLGRAQLVAAMHQIDVAGELRQKRRSSSIAESPPPTTTKGWFRKRGNAPSQTAQALTPRFLKASSDGSPK